MLRVDHILPTPENVTPASDQVGSGFDPLDFHSAVCWFEHRPVSISIDYADIFPGFHQFLQANTVMVRRQAATATCPLLSSLLTDPFTVRRCVI